MAAEAEASREARAKVAYSLYLLLVPSIFYINILVIFFTSFIGAIHLIFVFLVICDRDKRHWFIGCLFDLVDLIRLIKPMDHVN